MGVLHFSGPPALQMEAEKTGNMTGETGFMLWGVKISFFLLAAQPALRQHVIVQSLWRM